MRWFVFAVVAFALVVVELSVRNVFVLRSLGNIAPSFVFILVVFVSLFAPRSTTLWAAWALGMAIDLTTPIPQGGERVGPLIGAHALGFPFASFMVLQIRAMLFRRRALTLAVITPAAYIAATVVIIAVYAMHAWYPGEHLAWSERSLPAELSRRVGIGVYTGLLALVMNPLLVWTMPMWGFKTRRE
ncbi:MAG: rod shape-determining protein MreD [Phycisphaerales bacterium]|nr:rod shape-determining protein MreD [Phycisphaerae bacterium]NNF42812.1 rod shape-determining protein MreD [Phycisphaerales bacterium]NNM26569.1 rod shape-determining protein MreD [Phycisphaerales bacterium]